MQSTYGTTREEQLNSLFSTLATPVLLANGRVPSSHKRVADNYIIIKRFYKSQSLKSCILNSEMDLLRRYNRKALSELSVAEVNHEILTLQDWSFSGDDRLMKDAETLIQIRAKELRFILSSKYSLYSYEINNGYRALERYFEEITKFYNLPQ